MGDRGRASLGIACFYIPRGVHTSFLICRGFDGYGGDSSLKKIFGFCQELEVLVNFICALRDTSFYQLRFIDFIMLNDSKSS